MKLIKVIFIREGKAIGREYTYRTDVSVEVGDIVELPHAKPVMDEIPYPQGLVTHVDVPESEIEAFKDRVKTIIGKVARKDETHE